MKKYILQICFLFIVFYLLSTAVYALETNNTKTTEKQSITTENKDDLEEKSPLDKEFETVPNQTEEEITTEDDDWLNQKETAKDREINRKLQKRIVTTLFALFVVVILIFVVLKFLGSGKVNIPSLGLGKQGNILKIKERMFLQQGKALYLIKAGSKNILIGVSENKINYLTELSEKEIESENNNKQETQTEKNSYFSLFPKIKPIEPQNNTTKVKTEESSEE